MGRKDHAAGVVDDTFVGGGGNLVDELVYGGHSFSGGGGFLGADFADGNKYFVVNCAGIVKEVTDVFSDTFDAVVLQGWAGGGIGSILDFDAVGDSVVLVGREPEF